MLTTTAQRLKQTVTLVEERVRDGKSEDAFKDLTFLTEQYSLNRQWDKANCATRYMVAIAEGRTDTTFDVLPEDLDYHLSRKYFLARSTRRAVTTVIVLYGAIFAVMGICAVCQDQPLLLANLRCAMCWFDPHSFIDRAKIERTDGDLTNAVADCNKAIRLSRTNKEAHYALALCLFDQGRFADAYRQNQLSDRSKYEYWELKACIEIRQGHELDAAQDFDTSANLGKKSYLYLNERDSWALLGEYEKGLQAATSALSVAENSDQRADAYLAQARCLVKLSRWDEALTACANSLVLSPQKGFTYAVQAEALMGKGDYSAAAESASKSLTLKSFFERAYTVRAAAFDKLGRSADAASDRYIRGQIGEQRSLDN